MLFPENASVTCILSLSAGVRRLDAESTHRELASRYRDTGIYHRFDVDVEEGRSDVAFDEWEDIVMVKSAVDHYLADAVNEKRLKLVCQAMIDRKRGPLLRDLSEFNFFSALIPYV